MSSSIDPYSYSTTKTRHASTIDPFATSTISTLSHSSHRHHHSKSTITSAMPIVTPTTYVSTITQCPMITTIVISPTTDHTVLPHTITKTVTVDPYIHTSIYTVVPTDYTTMTTMTRTHKRCSMMTETMTTTVDISTSLVKLVPTSINHQEFKVLNEINAMNEHPEEVLEGDVWVTKTVTFGAGRMNQVHRIGKGLNQ